MVIISIFNIILLLIIIITSQHLVHSLMFGNLDASNYWWENKAILMVVILCWIFFDNDSNRIWWILESKPLECKILMSEVLWLKALKNWHDLLTHNSLYRHITSVTYEKCKQYCWTILNLDVEFFISNHLV